MRAENRSDVIASSFLIIIESDDVNLQKSDFMKNNS